MQPDGVRVSFGRQPGRTYEVELQTSPGEFLDWDAPIGDRADSRLAPFRSDRFDLSPQRGTDIESGATAYHRIADSLGSEEAAARALLEAGIPGLKYLDGMSRGVGQGTRNYVMFPGTEDRIRILRKYGLLAPMAAGAMQEDR
jgi:hypothetical protein